MMNRVTQRVTELKSASSVANHDKQIIDVPHFEKVVTQRVQKYVLYDRIIYVSSSQELCYSMPDLYIKSFKAKQNLYIYESKEYSLTELVDKKYIQPFLVFVEGQFIPWKYLNVICTCTRNYLLVHVDENDEFGSTFIKRVRALNNTADILVLPDSFKYKEFDNPVDYESAGSVMLGFDENWNRSKTSIKYKIYTVDTEIEHESDIFNGNTALSVNDNKYRYYDKDSCLIFKDGVLQTKLKIEFLGNVLYVKNAEDESEYSYDVFYNRRSGKCINHASKMIASSLSDYLTQPNFKKNFYKMVRQKYAMTMDNNYDYFTNIKNSVNYTLGYDSRDLLDKVYARKCGVVMIQLSGQHMINAAKLTGGVYKLSKYHNISLDDRIIVLRNGCLYGFEYESMGEGNPPETADRWRAVNPYKPLIYDDMDDWFTLQKQTEDTETEHEDHPNECWAILNNLDYRGTSEAPADYWRAVREDITIDESAEAVTDVWYSANAGGIGTIESVNDTWYNITEGETSEVDSNTDSWYIINDFGDTIGDDRWYQITEFKFDLRYNLNAHDEEYANEHTFEISILGLNPEDIVEIIVFKHVNNRITDVVINKDAHYNELSEDVYSLSHNIFCRTTKNPKYRFPADGLQHFPVGFTIASAGNGDPYSRRIVLDDDFYYGKELVIVHKKRFIHQRRTITAEEANSISFNLGVDFFYCNKPNNYCIFLNGRRVASDKYRVVLPVYGDKPYSEFLLYLGVDFTQGDILDIFYLPVTLKDVSVSNLDFDGLMQVERKDICNPLNNRSYMYWVNGVKVPQNAFESIDAIRAHVTVDMKSTNDLAIVQIGDELSETWITEKFKSAESEWDKLMSMVTVENIDKLLGIDVALQSSLLIPITHYYKDELLKIIEKDWAERTELIGY